MRRFRLSRLVIHAAGAAAAAFVLMGVALPAQAHTATNVPYHHVTGGCQSIGGYRGVWADPTWIEPWRDVASWRYAGNELYVFGDEYVEFRAMVTWKTADGQWATTRTGQWVRALNGFKGDFANYEHMGSDGKYYPAGFLPQIYARAAFMEKGHSVWPVPSHYPSGPYYVGYQVRWNTFSGSQYASPPLTQPLLHSQWMGWVRC